MRPDLIDVALSVYDDMLTATMPDKSDRTRAISTGGSASNVRIFDYPDRDVPM